MTNIPDLERRQKWKVRLLFIFVLAYFLAGMAIRKTVGEPYPGLFMPSFGGPGLEKMTAESGELLVPHFEINFTDHTLAKISLTRLCGRAVFGMALPHQVFLPQSEADMNKLRIDARINRKILSYFNPEPPTAGKIVFRPVTSDMQEFLKKRVKVLFPQKTATQMKFSIYRTSVRLADIKDQKIVGLLFETTISLQ
jgi:hypothetical protein